VTVETLAAAPVYADEKSLLETLRAVLGEQWRTPVMNVPTQALRRAFEAVGFGMKEHFVYRPLIHERQVAHLWHFEMNDDQAIAAAKAESAATGEPEREIPNFALRVKVVFRIVDFTDKQGRPDKALNCSLDMLAPDPNSTDGTWHTKVVLGKSFSLKDLTVAGITARAQMMLQAAIKTENHPKIMDDALSLANLVLADQAP
jgi:hypothetical protein